MRRLTALLFLACLSIPACTNRDVPIDWHRSRVIAQGDRPAERLAEPAAPGSPPQADSTTE